ncbi:MAG: type II secretion system protein GspC [Pseudomonadota bacterium]
MDFHRLSKFALQWSPRVTMALALVWLAAVLAQWTWRLVPEPPVDAGPLAPVQKVVPQPAPRWAETINTAALWGQPAISVSTQAQDTRLPLTLRGVLAGAGLALISASGQAERVYRVGDDLPGGARLRAVHEDHVLLERAGVLERLMLPKRELPSSASTSSGGAKSPPAPSLRAMLQGSPVELAKSFRIEPVLRDGDVFGYRLRALRDPQLLQRLGLQPDDILVRVNGLDLTQATDLPALMQDLREATALDAVVLRNGDEESLLIDLNE